MTSEINHNNRGCYVPRCNTWCALKHLMCAEHWQVLTSPMQLEVYRSLAALRRDKDDKGRTRYLKAINTARGHVVALEKSKEEEAS